jgi:hypothetical protein
LSLGVGLLFTSWALSQNLSTLPFDWSGQNGVITVDGALFWNRDWNAGLLFFDGSFASYPARYGSQFQRTFSPQIPSHYSWSDSLPDSAYVTTFVDYRRGDYLFDQLEIHSTLANPSNALEIYGFKRSYGGPWGQFYQQPQGPVGPIQQSYRLDYHSREGPREWGSAAAYLVTNSGLPDTAFTKRGSHREQITTATLLYQYHGNSWTWFSHGSLFNQVTQLKSTILPSPGTRYFTRGRLHNRWSKLSTSGHRWDLGVVANIQDYSFTSLGYKQRAWALFYGGRRAPWGELQLGFGKGPGETEPYVSFKSHTIWSGIELGLRYLREPRPRLISYWQPNEGQFFENWSRARLSLSREGSRLDWGGDIMYTQVDNYFPLHDDLVGNAPITAQAMTYSLRTNLRLFGTWYLRGAVRLTTPQDPLSDGIGQYFLVGLNGRQGFFADKMDARLNIWVERWTDRDTTLGFHPFQNIPFQTRTIKNPLSENWVVHFQISAQVSSLKMTYRVDNVLYAIKPLALKLFPGLKEEDLWLRNNYFLNGIQYPLARMVSFQIEWEFKD